MKKTIQLTVPQRLENLRQIMTKHHLDALIIPTMDPHATEYLPVNWKLREYISGFDGSAGTLIVTLEHAALWTDFRYWIEAEKQLTGSGIELKKQGATETETQTAWLKNHLKKGNITAYDAMMVSHKFFETVKTELAAAEIELIVINGLCDEIWLERPMGSKEPIRDYAVKYAGVSRHDKLMKIRKKMTESSADYHLITSLYDIAWIFNLRGNDTPYTPIFTAFALISKEGTVLFSDEKKFSVALLKKLSSENISVRPYGEIANALTSLSAKESVMLVPDQTPEALWRVLPENCRKVEIEILPSAMMKAVKNEIEIEHLHSAMIADGVALSVFFCTIEKMLAEKIVLSEYDAVELMKNARELNSLGLSFATIAGYNANGAMCHYKPTRRHAAVLKRKGLLLVDSGSQYHGATTDITRTVALGDVSQEMIRDFTLVLKGHLRLSHAVFPDTATGAQLDPLVRQDMWQECIDFGHGTGHGIGSYLNVHEGPQGVSSSSKVKLLPGMLLTNEPGIYREGKYGIRTENIILTVPHKKTPFGTFLTFETMTLFPYDTTLIDTDLLTETEIEQINVYHKRVYKALSPYLRQNCKAWLRQKTLPIFK